MIIDNAKDILYNGVSVQAVVVNNNVVWPVSGKYDIACYGLDDGVSSVALGLTATKDGSSVFSQVPTVTPFTASNIPVNSTIVCRFIAPSGYTASVDVTGLEVSSTLRLTGSGSASAVYRFNPLRTDAVVSVDNFRLNTFTASGGYAWMGGSVDNDTLRQVPATMSYIGMASGQGLPSAVRNMYYYGDDGSSIQGTRYFSANAVYSAVTISAVMSSTIAKSMATYYPVTMTSRIYNGTGSTSHSAQISAYLGTTTKGSASGETSNIATFNGTSFNPSSSGLSPSNLYLYRNISGRLGEYKSATMGTTGYWTATGILA